MSVYVVRVVVPSRKNIYVYMHENVTVIGPQNEMRSQTDNGQLNMAKKRLQKTVGGNSNNNKHYK